MQHVTTIYRQHGFTVRTILANGEFEPIWGPLAKIHVGLNCASEGEHVPVIERYIQTVKERVRAVYNSLPFRRYLPWLVVEMVYAAVFWLNAFPPENGVSTMLSL